MYVVLISCTLTATVDLKIPWFETFKNIQHLKLHTLDVLI